MDENAFDQLISGIEQELNVQRLQKQGAYAVTSARIAGMVYAEALAGGVPHALAQEMATDTWNTAMNLTPQDDTEDQ